MFKFDLSDLMIFFDELQDDPTDEEFGIYAFRSHHPNGYSIHFSVSLYERFCLISIKDINNTEVLQLKMRDCSYINILDMNRKCLEVVHENSKNRCFLWGLGSPIITYDTSPNII